MPKIDVNTQLCKGCELCIPACPKKVIGLSKTFSSTGYYPATMVNASACNGCRLCAFVCPDVAITVYK